MIKHRITNGCLQKTIKKKAKQRERDKHRKIYGAHDGFDPSVSQYKVL